MDNYHAVKLINTVNQFGMTSTINAIISDDIFIPFLEIYNMKLYLQFVCYFNCSMYNV